MSNLAAGILIGFGAGLATRIAAGLNSSERKARKEIKQKSLD